MLMDDGREGGFVISARHGVGGELWFGKLLE